MTSPTSAEKRSKKRAKMAPIGDWSHPRTKEHHIRAEISASVFDSGYIFSIGVCEKMKTTRSPWVVKREKDSSFKQPLKRIGIWNDRFRLATVQRIEDAHLISACLDLYESCKEMYDLVSQYDMRFSTDLNGHRKLMDRARAAIKKAEGGK